MVPGLYLSGAACMTNIRVCGELSSAVDEAGERALGEDGGVSRAAPQVRHT